MVLCLQVVNVFLAMALGSSAAAVATQIVEDPGKALQQLSSNFPKSVNFYYSYLCLQGLTISSGTLLQLVALILSHILGRILMVLQELSGIDGTLWVNQLIQLFILVSNC